MIFREWQVAWTRRAHRDLRRIVRAIAARIYAAIVRFAETGQGDVRRLSARENQWRLRVGDYRVRFIPDYESQTIQVLGCFTEAKRTGTNFAGAEQANPCAPPSLC